MARGEALPSIPLDLGFNFTPPTIVDAFAIKLVETVRELMQFERFFQLLQTYDLKC